MVALGVICILIGLAAESLCWLALGVALLGNAHYHWI